MGFILLVVGALVVALRSRASLQVRRAFALWYFDANRSGTQAEWAKANGVHPSTLSIWKSEAWFRELAGRWREQYEMEFGEVVRPLYLRAVDIEHPHGVQAARILAELLDKFPDKTAGPQVDIFSWLALLPPEQAVDTVSDGR